MAKIEASRAAAIFFFFRFFFPQKYCPFLENFFVFCKNEKKVSSRTFLSHPAGLPETELFLWTALLTVIELKVDAKFAKGEELGRLMMFEASL